MKLASTLCLAAASIAALAAIWSPWHWQSAATAVLLVLIGAGLGGRKEPDIEVHLHDFHGYSPEEVAEEITRQDTRSAALRPQGGERGAERTETGPDALRLGEANIARGKNDYGRSAK